MGRTFLCCRVGKDGGITEVHVFPGKSLSKEEVSTAQDEMRSGKFEGWLSNVFSDKSVREAARTKGVVHDISIHRDSSIKQIKASLCYISPSLLFSTLYLYTTVDKQLTTDAIYRDLKSSNTSAIDGYRLKSFMMDLQRQDDASGIEPDKTYEYGDVVNLGMTNGSALDVTCPLGVQFQPAYSAPADPTASFAQQDIRSYSRNGDLLLKYGSLRDNTIYFIDYRDFPDLSPAYFPSLASDGISSYEAMTPKLEDLRQQSQEIVKISNVVQTSRKMDTVNLIAANVTVQNKILYTSGSLSIFPESPFDLPLDIVFKNLHSTVNRPLIKYNPGRRQEKIYRLYANSESSKGKKIPYMSKSLIFRLAKTLGSEKQLAVFVLANDFPVFVNVFPDSSSTIAFKTNKPLAETELLTILKASYNSIIKVINDLMSSNGYSLPTLESFDSPIVRFNSVNLEFEFELPKDDDSRRALKCMDTVFTPVPPSLKTNNIQMVYTRVSNFNRMNLMDEYITNSINSGVQEKVLLSNLVSKFGLKDEDEAKRRLLEFVSQQQIVRDAFRSNRVKIQGNPGIKIEIEPNRFKGTLKARAIGVDSFEYVEFIERYLRVFVALAESDAPSELGVTKAALLELCSQEGEAKKTEEPVPVIEALNQGDNEVKAQFMDLLMSDDDTTDEDTEEDEPSAASVPSLEGLGEAATKTSSGGARTKSANIDVKGMKLLNPNPFSLLLQEREPILFKAKKDSGTYSYARACPSNNRRQPVILTAQEKERIDREHPGSYTKALSYRSSPEAQTYHYICPRYWDLNRKTSLTEKEAQSGKFGKVIPQGARKVPADASIYQFDSGYHKDAKGNSIPLYPGFMKPKGHPHGKCVPCCFKSWDAPARVKLRKECAGEAIGEEESSKRSKFDDYVKGPEKWPLEAGRLGFLTPGLEVFFGLENSRCQVSKSDANLKPNTPCLVRLGVSGSRKVSFLAAIASGLAEVKGQKEVTVPSLIKTLVKVSDIDYFYRLQNGALVSLFAPKTSPEPPAGLTESKLSASVDSKNPAELAAYNKIEGAHKAFIEYLTDPNSSINHQYLWDLVTSPSKELFPRGINLIILEEPSADLTNDIRILCPSNPYKDKLYHRERPSLVLYLKDGMYEVLVIYEDRKKEYAITKLFPSRSKSKDLLAKIIAVLNTVQLASSKKCLPLPSLPKVYEYSQGALAEKTLGILRFMNYKVDAEVLNYNGKTVGFLATRGKLSGYVPCQPSTRMAAGPSVTWLDNIPNNSYDNTISFLTEVNDESKGALGVVPMGRIVEDGMNVAVLTSSNQAILVEPSAASSSDPLPTINSSKHTGVDRTIITEAGVDTERVDAMRRINSETAYYNAFRNQIRLLLTSYSHLKEREALIKVLESDQSLDIQGGSLTAQCSKAKKHGEGNASNCGKEPSTAEGKSPLKKKKKRCPKGSRRNKKTGRCHSTTTGTVVLTQNNKPVRALTPRKDDSYQQKLNEIANILYSTVSDKVSFAEADTDTLTSFGSQGLTLCNANDEKCALVLPKINLINGLDNENAYFVKVADEFLRYTRIRKYLLSPDAYLSFDKMPYKLNKDEVILLQSLLEQSYFDDLVPVERSQYITGRPYDFAEPDKSEPYSDKVELVPSTEQEDDDASGFDCAKPSIMRISAKWAKLFPVGAEELVFSSDPATCTFQPVAAIIGKVTGAGQDISAAEVKQDLIKAYDRMWEKFGPRILKVLASEGKRKMVQRIMSGKSSLSVEVLSPDYICSRLDLWVLAQKFQLPIVLYTPTTFRHSKRPLLPLLDVRGGSVFFLKTGSQHGKYRMMIKVRQSSFEIKNMKQGLRKLLGEALEAGDYDLDRYLVTFKPLKLKVVKEFTKKVKLGKGA